MKRIQRKYKIKLPENTVSVDQSSRFRSPFILRNGYIHFEKRMVINERYVTISWIRWSDIGGKKQQDIVDLYELWITNQLKDFINLATPPNISRLNSFDLASWKPLSEPCHSDVLINLLTQ